MFGLHDKGNISGSLVFVYIWDYGDKYLICLTEPFQKAGNSSCNLNNLK